MDNNVTKAEFESFKNAVTTHLFGGVLTSMFSPNLSITNSGAGASVSRTNTYNLLSPTRTVGSSTELGTPGDIAWDNAFLYLCCGDGKWRRVAIALF